MIVLAKSTIIKELANNTISLEVALNRLFIIASDIENHELQNWAECELHGYGNNQLPDYRYAKNTLFRYSGISGSFKVTEAPLPLLQILKSDDPSMFYLPIYDGISTIEDHVNNKSQNEFGRDLTWAAGMVFKMSGIQCYSIKQIVPVNIFDGILNNVKMILMKIFIKLDKTYGCLDELDIQTEEVDPKERAETNAIINQYIYINNSVKIGDKNKFENTGIVTGGEKNG